MSPSTEYRQRNTEYKRQNTEFSSLLYVLHLRLLFVFTVVPFLVIGAFSPAAMGAESLAGPAIADGFGVNIHFTGLPQDLRMIADAGFKFIRMDLAWSRIEQTKGVYDFKESGYDSLTLGCRSEERRVGKECRS